MFCKSLLSFAGAGAPRADLHRGDGGGRRGAPAGRPLLAARARGRRRRRARARVGRRCGRGPLALSGAGGTPSSQLTGMTALLLDVRCDTVLHCLSTDSQTQARTACFTGGRRQAAPTRAWQRRSAWRWARSRGPRSRPRPSCSCSSPAPGAGRAARRCRRAPARAAAACCSSTCVRALACGCAAPMRLLQSAALPVCAPSHAAVPLRCALRSLTYLKFSFLLFFLSTFSTRNQRMCMGCTSPLCCCSGCGPGRTDGWRGVCGRCVTAARRRRAACTAVLGMAPSREHRRTGS